MNAAAGTVANIQYSKLLLKLINGIIKVTIKYKSISDQLLRTCTICFPELDCTKNPPIKAITNRKIMAAYPSLFWAKMGKDILNPGSEKLYILSRRKYHANKKYQVTAMPIMAMIHSDALNARVISNEKRISIRKAMEGKYKKEQIATTIPILKREDCTCLLLYKLVILPHTQINNVLIRSGALNTFHSKKNEVINK